ncbi:hypothetical protein [Ferrimonas kyonanensis]|uniref:hypothetical protein n=1 Tax=Ferrimonas kyonanensis TaxID=364763 RepID=UPI0012EC2BF9|nr:hypothetical protein [Ferrimonas kyonanensis]
MKKFLALIMSFLSFAPSHADTSNFVSYQDTKPVLKKLSLGQMPYEFFGLTSNGVDCVYFVFENGIYSLEFEVMVEPQKHVAEKFKEWASINGLHVSQTTYGNQPQYTSTSTAPVYRVILGGNLEETYRFGLSFYHFAFGYEESKLFELVP